ncbi:MAG TPA: GNAT family N-acetyltransferase [Candidatus Dormibacteraeota bacterium]|nr:GNAT family N-acetyltransferase [Candidatus Dormibacteraeota bacterium]
MTLFQADTALRNPSPDEVIEFLGRDRPWSAYALGYLDPAAGVPTRVLGAEREGQIQALVVQAELPQLLSLYATGDPEAIASVIQELPVPPASGVFSIRAEAVDAFERHLRVSTAYRMRRMVIGRGELNNQPMPGMVRLGLKDLEPVKRLYGLWTDSHQLPGQLSNGVYYGVYEGRELIAIAGTHCVSPTFGVGAIGNVLTHINDRNRGLASATTTAVAEELFRLGCDEIVLNVRHGNEVAYRCYARLGFRDHCTFVEGVFHSRLGRK